MTKLVFFILGLLHLFTQSFGQKQTAQPITVGVLLKTVQNGGLIYPSTYVNIQQPGLAGQLSDSLNYQIQSTFVSSLTPLAYQVYVVGNSDSPSDNAQITMTDIQNLQNHLAGGGGLVLFGTIYCEFLDSSIASAFQSICPITTQTGGDSGGTVGVCLSSTTTTFTPTSPNPVNADLWYQLSGGTQMQGAIDYSPGGLYTANNPVTQITVTGADSCQSNPNNVAQYQGAVTQIYGSGGGRIAYLALQLAGNTYNQNPINYRINGNPGDLLFENSVFWASGYVAICPQGCGTGVCEGTNNTCDCTGTGYTGASCNTPICPNQCYINGYCTGPNQCSCNTGWSGPTCQTPICNPPCQNGGICVSPNSCNCNETLYVGAQCQTPTCTPSCVNGNCIAVNNCSCTAGWQGVACDQQQCVANCNVAGSQNCTATSCTPCLPEWTGMYCETPLYNCTNPCQRGGTCLPNNTCDCSRVYGYGGPVCATPICNPPCENGGQCESPPNVCNCTGTFYGGLTCTDLLCNVVCVNGGYCIGNNTCSCPMNWTGPNCQTPICNPACENGGLCIGPNLCFCGLTNYTGPTCGQPACIYPYDCRNNGTCVAPFTCNCSEGYYGFRCLFQIEVTTDSSQVTPQTTGSILGIPPIAGVSGDEVVFSIVGGVLAFICVCVTIFCILCLASKVRGGNKQQPSAREMALENYD